MHLLKSFALLMWYSLCYETFSDAEGIYLRIFDSVSLGHIIIDTALLLTKHLFAELYVLWAKDVLSHDLMPEDATTMCYLYETALLKVLDILMCYWSSSIR